MLPSPLHLAIALALLAADPAAAPAPGSPPNAQPPPAPTEAEGPPAKGGPRPLLGVTPRPGPSPDLPKPPKDPAQRRDWLKAQLEELFNAKPFANAKSSLSSYTMTDTKVAGTSLNKTRSKRCNSFGERGNP